MYCSNCGKKQPVKAQFCQNCGFGLDGGVTTETKSKTEPARGGQGFAITGIVLGGLAVFFALFDFAMVGSGEYDYVLPEEIGFLVIASLAGLVFSVIALSKKNKMGTLATVLSGSALFLTLLLSTYAY
jgi:hypothetical protein